MIAYDALVDVARSRMGKSRDPLHDLSHVERVLNLSRRIAATSRLTEQERQALELAVWWHDISRSFFRRPAAFILLRFCDDMLSAIALWAVSFRFGFFGAIPGMACRIIFCKNIGTGALLTQLLLRRRTRHILHILSDADKIDIISVPRIEILRELTNSRVFFAFLYRTWFFWFKNMRDLRLKTSAGKEVRNTAFSDIATWFSRSDISEWHKQKYGDRWMEKSEKHFYAILSK